MNDTRYREALIAYSLTLPENISDDDRERVLLAYLDELAEADISRTANAGSALLDGMQGEIDHDIKSLQHEEESDKALIAAREVLGH